MSSGKFGRRSVLAGMTAGAALPAQRAAAQAAAPGGAITASILGNLPNIHPWHVANIETGAANLLVYSNLIRIAPDGTLVPDAATELPKITENGTVYTFQLRGDVRFHNGDKMTANTNPFCWIWLYFADHQ